MTSPALIIHGGLTSGETYERNKEAVDGALKNIAHKAFVFLNQYKHTAVETVAYAVSLLEDNPLFNAGTGSKFQSDGIIRMTASIMDGSKEIFAGVMNIREIKNPVQIAATLLRYEDRVLAGEEAQNFARKQGFVLYNPETRESRCEYQKKIQDKYGTVGCVARDIRGLLAAATSTGGKGFEIPGRVSDSATVAGNYANCHAAVSCTGIGEDIVDAALAARIVTRVTDGMSLEEASIKSLKEVKKLEGIAGIIALDAKGNLFHGATTPYLTYAIGS